MPVGASSGMSVQATLSGSTTAELVLRKAEAWERWQMDMRDLQPLQLHCLSPLNLDRMHMPLPLHVASQTALSELVAEREGRSSGPRCAMDGLKTGIKAST